MKPSPQDRPREPDNRSSSIKSTTAVLAFGIITLLYLVAIDHEEWFHLRPMSAGAVAISNSADHHRAPADVGREGLAR